MTKTPDAWQYEWSPYQVFQVRIEPERGVYKKSYRTVGGDKTVYEYDISMKGRHPADKHLHSAYGKIYSAFNVPYFQSKGGIGGRLTRARTTPDIFTIAIGVTDLRKKHKDAMGDGSISYELLFELLDELGFRPLETLHRNRRKIENEMEEAINSLISSGAPLSRQSFRTKLAAIAEHWKGEVWKYIAGSTKPKLARKTTEVIRPMKKEKYGVPYPMGISKPMVESGQLLEAIDFSVFVDQSSDMRHYIDRAKEIEKRTRRGMAKKSEKQIRREEEKKTKRQIRKETYAKEKAERELVSAKRKRKSGIITAEQFDEAATNARDKIYAEETRREDSEISKRKRTISDIRARIDILKCMYKRGQKTGTVNGVGVNEWAITAREEMDRMVKTFNAAKQYLEEHGIEV